MIAERLTTTDTVIAAAFHGLSVREVEDLRAKLREADAQFQVVKNTLARRACDETGKDALLEYLEGQTALVWAAGDPAAIAKALNTFAKASENRLSMKGGILDGAPVSADELKKLAALPPRDELLARLVRGVASPLQGTANALNSLLSGLATALGQYEAQRAAEAPAEAAPAEEAPAAEAPAAEATEAPAEDAPAAEEAPAEDAPAAEEAPAAEAEAEPEASTEDTNEAEQDAAADDTPEAAQEPAADDNADAEPAADETTEGD
ncbi:MAG: 50S ribosomal protein L10 [Acidobacteria bacterium]|nr:50S ribosomal protein L10 [Acidobacteriota bacterium]